MLPTQVNYWANKEIARHNRVMEAIDYGKLGVQKTEAAIAQQNAFTNQANALTNATNAATAIENAQVNKRNAEVNAINAQTNIDNLNLNKLVSDRNYEIGLTNAASAATQARAATSQATTAASRASYDNQYTQSKTEYQDKENSWFTVTRAAEVAETATRALRNVGISFDSLGSGARTLFSNLSYHLRN